MDIDNISYDHLKLLSSTLLSLSAQVDIDNISYDHHKIQIHGGRVILALTPLHALVNCMGFEILV